MISKLILLRHGKTDLAGKYVGVTDVDLSECGVQQIKNLRSSLLQESVDQVLCSPLLRCRKSLEILNLSCQTTFEEKLQEVDFGEWEGKSFDEVVVSHPNEVDRWAEGKTSFCFPGGECLDAFIDRLEDMKKEILEKDGETLLVVAHGGVIRHLICSFLGLPYSNYLLFQIKEARYAVLDIYKEGAVLSCLNRG